LLFYSLSQAFLDCCLIIQKCVSVGKLEWLKISVFRALFELDFAYINLQLSKII